MSETTKRLGAVFLAILMLVAGQLTLAGPQNSAYQGLKIYTDYGLVSEVPAPKAQISNLLTKLPPKMSAAALRRHPLLFKLAGGVMFDAVATPCEKVNRMRMKLAYDESRPDGQRLLLYFGNQAHPVDGVYDYELRPIAQFAGDTNPVVVNLQAPKYDEACEVPAGVRRVMLHPAFVGAKLGLLLTRADAIAWSFLDGKRWWSTEPLPETAKEIASQARAKYLEDYAAHTDQSDLAPRSLFHSGRAALARIGNEERRELAERVVLIALVSDWEKYEESFRTEYAISKLDWNKFTPQERRMLIVKVDRPIQQVSNINDVGASPSFCVEDDHIVLDGDPHVEICASLLGSPKQLKGSTAVLTANQWALKLADPDAFGAMLKVYRLGGLFRYVKAQSPLLWRQFVRSLPATKEDKAPDIVCPDCKREEVVNWLGCVQQH